MYFQVGERPPLSGRDLNIALSSQMNKLWVKLEKFILHPNNEGIQLCSQESECMGRQEKVKISP